MNYQYDYIIVGAGLFGAVVAHELTSRGKRCLVVERRSHLAGNIYTAKIENIHVHQYGAHIFHTHDESIWRYIQQFGAFSPYINAPIARYKERVFNLPFNMNTFNQLWGVTTPEQAKLKIAEAVAPYAVKDPKNLEEKALSMVGPEIYEYLVKGYTEKQWGRSAKELPAFIINRLPLRFTYDNNYFNDMFQGIPNEGYTSLITNMLKGIEVRVNFDYLSNRKLIESLAPSLIYTGRIDEFFDYQLGMLDYRSLRFETTILPTDNYQGNSVVNYTERDVPYTRVIEHRHFDRYVQSPSTVVTHEYPDEFAPGKEAYYPINNERNNQLYLAYADLAKKTPHVFFGGRLGNYRYFDMDDTIIAALELVKQLV